MSSVLFGCVVHAGALVASAAEATSSRACNESLAALCQGVASALPTHHAGLGAAPIATAYSPVAGRVALFARPSESYVVLVVCVASDETLCASGHLVWALDTVAAALAKGKRDPDAILRETLSRAAECAPERPNDADSADGGGERHRPEKVRVDGAQLGTGAGPGECPDSGRSDSTATANGRDEPSGSEGDTDPYGYGPLSVRMETPAPSRTAVAAFGAAFGLVIVIVVVITAIVATRNHPA